jgi:hypothetical protein
MMTTGQRPFFVINDDDQTAPLLRQGPELSATYDSPCGPRSRSVQAAEFALSARTASRSSYVRAAIARSPRCRAAWKPRHFSVAEPRRLPDIFTTGLSTTRWRASRRRIDCYELDLPDDGHGHLLPAGELEPARSERESARAGRWSCASSNV